ncbi:glycosyltransferase [Microbacterium immunditiarum]|uniref:Glycosyltransferase involved in cell wall biosynthesis n=1 Tax=Microbacterium immunditiarum TaxID=337480 RepID=A0A7Y9KKE8_9MICO|nr:glycosyltransferase involved in cell wall biosynthesis [Microbacterium immunditiarum]
MTSVDVAPHVSVIIAAYNAEETLDAQLDALERQTADFPFEVLVCDNGSTDGTAAVTHRRLERMPHLRLVDASATRGPGAARNAGARAARAPFLAFCDADDVVSDDWLALMHASLSEAPFVSGTSRRPELNSRPENPTYFDWSLYRMPFFPYLAGAGAGNMGIHKAVFDEVGGFDETLRTGEDLDLCWRVQLAGYPLIANSSAIVNVSNRAGLRATMRQGFGYGAGDKRLTYKFARVAEAYEARPPMPDVDEAAGGEASGSPAAGDADGGSQGMRDRIGALVARVLRKFRRRPRTSDFTEITLKIATALGFRFGRIDTSVPQVEPPEKLPG